MKENTLLPIHYTQKVINIQTFFHIFHQIQMRTHRLHSAFHVF